MTYYIQQIHSGIVQRIEQSEDLIDIEIAEALGSETLTGDEAMRRRFDVLKAIVGRLVAATAVTYAEELELVGLWGHEVTKEPE